MTNKRLFSRIPFVGESQIEVDGETFEGKLLNIALKGALLRFSSPVPLQEKDSCTLKFNLTSSDIVLTFKAEVVHISETNYGFKFLSEDLNTMTHLRRLMELNMGDEEKISQELSFL